MKMIIRRRQTIILLLSLIIIFTVGYGDFGQVDLSENADLSEKPDLSEIQDVIRPSWTGTGYVLESCNCTKHKTKTGESLPGMRLKSTCSDEADWYGPGQKVVSYVLHNDTKHPDPDPFDLFVSGIIPNIYQVRQLYPGWIIRFYTDQELTPPFCDFACMDEVMWCDIRQLTFANLTNVNFRMWRFMALGDPTVETFVSRDIDSFICEREREAVTDWEISSQPFHIMRDSETHHRRPILAGLWGAKNYLLDSTISLNLRQQLILHGTNNTHFATDEQLLDALLFQKYESKILAHDSYNCKRYSKSAVPYPKQRKNRNTRIALSIRVFHNFEAPPCPIECRPSYGKDWTYC